ncbi:hypothetical protein [Paenibacillus catalpae]|uniref:hypothetical protein n=1 Tax=Paenibacillus catalpae TaxID=1045775 RepID=UPI000B286128|nr:hypothetical protein [Paenibacillus catalpae]
MVNTSDLPIDEYAMLPPNLEDVVYLYIDGQKERITGRKAVNVVNNEEKVGSYVG